MEKENVKLNPVAYWEDEDKINFWVYFECNGNFIVVTQEDSFATPSLLNDMYQGISLFDENSLKEYEEKIVEYAHRITKRNLSIAKKGQEEIENAEERIDLKILRERGLI